MHRILKKPIVLASAVVLASTTFAFATASADTTHRPTPRIPAAGSMSVGSLDGLNATVLWHRAVWYGAAHANIARIETAAAAARARVRIAAPVRSGTTGGGSLPVTGTCAAMKPAGFPDWIIQRESGGNPQARNSDGGAYGCAQIMPEHYRSGGACVGLDYQACWARLWNGGRGASNWSCGPGSGCE